MHGFHPFLTFTSALAEPGATANGPAGPWLISNVSQKQTVKLPLLFLFAALAFSTRAVACIEVALIDGKNFATFEHPFQITFQEEVSTIQVTLSYSQDPKFGALTVIRGVLKSDPSTGRDIQNWLLSKTEKEMKGNFSLPPGKSMFKIFVVPKGDFDRAVFSGGFDGEHDVTYYYALADIFRAQRKNG